MEASEVAEVLVAGVGEEPLQCWSYQEEDQGARLTLKGIRFPAKRIPVLRISDGSQVQGIELVFDNKPPYWITTVVFLTADPAVWPLHRCGPPANQVFGTASTATAPPAVVVVTSTFLPTNTIEPTVSARTGCWNAPPPRLHVGQYAYVSLSPPVPNRMRSAPSLTGKVIGWAQPGRSMKVLEGPVCSDGWAWWRVRLTGTHVEGWTAEGDGDEYWLVPCSTLNECP